MEHKKDKTLRMNEAVLTIQSCFFRKRHHYTSIRFDQDLKALQKANQEEIAEGKYDIIVKKCLKFCRIRQNKFLLHKLAFTLFSGITLWDDSSKPFFKYTKLLKHLLYKDIQDIHLISRLVDDAYLAWKEECRQKASTRIPVRSFDKQDILEYLLRSARSLEEDSSKSNFIKLFTDSSEEVKEKKRLGGWKNYVEGNEDYANKILQLLKKYLPASSDILQSFTQTTSKLEQLLQQETVLEEELSVLKEEILSVWETTWYDIQLKENNVGIVPLTTPSFNPRSRKMAPSYGGGLFFWGQFLLGKNKGYKTDMEEGGLGVYVAPYESPIYDDKYYAERAAERHFDIPISVNFEIEPQYLQSTVRHDYEAILCHTNRKKVQVHDIKPLRYRDSYFMLREEDLSIYANDPDVYQKLHTLFDAQMSKSHVTVHTVTF